MKHHAIAIDGPSGAGKSTMAKAAAKELGYLYVDTGAIYRTVGYHMWLMGIGPKDADGIRRLIDDVNIVIDHQADGVQHMILNGMDVKNRMPEKQPDPADPPAKPIPERHPSFLRTISRISCTDCSIVLPDVSSFTASRAGRSGAISRSESCLSRFFISSKTCA